MPNCYVSNSKWMGFALSTVCHLQISVIEDGRRFNNTLVIYTSWYAEVTSQTLASANQQPLFDQPIVYQPPAGTKLITIAWDASLEIDWEETFLNDPKKIDPLAGIDRSGASSRRYRF